MTKRKNSYNSSLRYLLFALILIAFYGLSSIFYVRIDLTKEGRYSLSKQSKNFLQSLNTDYAADIYLSGDLPYSFHKLQEATISLLEELNKQSKRTISYHIIEIDTQNPSEMQALTRQGLQYTSVNIKDKKGRITQQILFPSLILHNKKKQVAVPLLKNNPNFSGQENLNHSIASLEYELLSGLRILERKKLPLVAFLKGQGELQKEQTIDFAKSLAENYQIIETQAKELSAKISALIVAQPRENFKEEDKFWVDQYIMNGGKVLFLIDEVAVSKDSLRANGSAMAFYKPLNIEDQLFSYGVRINPNLVLDLNADLVKINTALKGEPARFSPLPWSYEPLLEGNPSHPITKGIAPIRCIFANAIDTIANSKIKKTPLLKTSIATKLRGVPRLIKMDEIRAMQEKEFYTSSFVTVGVLLEGKFPSIFKGRPAYSKRENFKEESLPSKIIVISDGDIIKNETKGAGNALQFLPLGYNEDYKYLHGNKAFLLNAIDYLCDDKGWLSLRNKEFTPSLLNKTKAREERNFWQLLNVLLPLVSLILFAFGYHFYRKWKFGK